MNLEDEVINAMSKQMSDEIDFEILSGMLCELGWTRVVLRPMISEQGKEIDEWMSKNIKRPFETMGLVWLFENEQDANWFKLRWAHV